MLRLIEIDKTYGVTHALKSFSVDVTPGTVLGLVGENGAGKSTLIKIVSGAISADHGRITLDDKTVSARNSHEAMTHGIASVYQELTVVCELTVEQNLMLSAAPVTAWGSIDRRRMRTAARDILERYKLDFLPQTRVGDLPLGQQQMLEIVRAVERRPRVLLLDEATSALGSAEVEWLAALIGRLRDDGCIVLFISHRWDEIVRFSNRVAVLRNGELMAVTDTADMPEREAVRLMTGRATVEEGFPARQTARGGTALSVREARSGMLDGISLDLGRGEILGIGGLVGQGQGHLLEACFGAHRLDSGAIEIEGAPLEQPSPRRAIRAGIAYVPQERKTEGLLLTKSVAVNATLAILRGLRKIFGIIDPADESAIVRKVIDRAQVVTPGPAEPIRNLSGGNQQKVLLEKWLLTKPRILLLNDVTRGVDVATKRQIYDTIARLAAEGAGVIWYSTDARELVGVAHRVIVMLHGRISAELSGADATVDRIIHAAVVGSSIAGDPR